MLLGVFIELLNNLVWTYFVEKLTLVTFNACPLDSRKRRLYLPFFGCMLGIGKCLDLVHSVWVD